MKRKLIVMAHAAAPENAFVEMLNAVAIDDGAQAPDWIHVPYAEVPYDANVVGMQRLNKAVAERMCNAMSRAMVIEPRLSAGLPFYLGHPDFVNANDPDALRKWLQNQPPSFGWMKEFRAGESTLDIRVEWTKEGAALINSKTYRFFSIFFRSQPVELVNGLQYYEPRLIQSAGLTNTPNWPMPPMVNADTQLGGGKQGGGMDLLQRLIALLGDDAIKTEDDVVNAVANIINAIKKIRDSIDARWKAEDATRQALPNASDPFALMSGYIEFCDKQLLVVTANSASLKTSQALAETLQGQIKAVRTEFATAMVNAAVARGAVLQEQATARIEDMVNAGDAFGARLKDLAALPKIMKTETQAPDVSKRGAAVADRRTKVLDMVNAALPAHGNNYDAAFADVQKQHPELFDSPEK